MDKVLKKVRNVADLPGIVAASCCRTASWPRLGAAFGCACRSAGRSMSRHRATRRWQGRPLVEELSGRGILIRSPSLRGVPEEAPGAY
jgi:tRNA-splicing ligase RtcB